MLISESEIANFKPLGRSVSGIDSFIEDAELELRRLLGRSFFSFVSETDDVILLNGNKDQKGIKRLLIELFWIELLKSESYQVTASGVVQKKTEDSQIISDDTRRRLVRSTRKNAYQIFKDIAYYLNENKEAYLLYNREELVNIFSTTKTTLI